MVKPTQTIRRQPPTKCLSVFDHFVGLALKGLTFRLFHVDKSNATLAQEAYHYFFWKISYRKYVQSDTNITKPVYPFHA